MFRWNDLSVAHRMGYVAELQSHQYTEADNGLHLEDPRHTYQEEVRHG